MTSVLSESHVSADLSILDRAWRDPQTFALLPDKTPVAPGWVDEALRALPAPLRTGHFVLLTSGSTGKPKLVIGSRERAEALARVLHELQDSAPVAETILVLPLNYCYGFVNQWLWSRCFSRRLVRTDGFSQPDALGRALRQATDAMLCLVGAQVPLLTQYFGQESFPGVMRLHFAGGRFPQERLDVIRQLFPRAEVFNNYGCAEAMPRLTLRRAGDADVAHNIGRPLPGIELTTDEMGALRFRSPYSAVGYVDASGFHGIDADTWVPSGDLGERNPDMTWRLSGRANEVFKRYGEKISLPVLLNTVATVWPHQAVFYRERDNAGEEGHVLMLSPHPQSSDVQFILQAFRAATARTHWPLRVESAPRLPALPNGKTDVLSLPAMPDKVVHWSQRV